MDAQQRFEELVDDLLARNPEVETTKMMGMPSLKRSGKLFAGFVTSEAAMVFKFTDAAERERALALPGAHLFDPMGGRPMREWVVVPEQAAAEWPQLAEAARR